MTEMRTISKEAHDWLIEIPVHMRSRHAFDSRAKSDHITNNVSEYFNQWINPIRALPLVALVDQLRLKMMARFHGMYQKGVGFNGALTPVTKKKLDKGLDLARGCQSYRAGVDEFEVTDGYTKYVVDLRSRTCGCGAWKISGLPCKHVVSAILQRTRDLEDYCDMYYRVEKYLQAYAHMIHPLPDLSTVQDEPTRRVLQPPICKRPRGRPHKSRNKEADETVPNQFMRRSGTVKCDNCKREGHNRRTCKGAPVAERSRRSTQGNLGKRKTMTDSQRQTRSQTHGSSSQVTVQQKCRGRIANKQARDRLMVRVKGQQVTGANVPRDSAGPSGTGTATYDDLNI